MSMPAACLSLSPVRCPADPGPAEPKLIFPGRAFAIAMNSCSDFAGWFALTRKALAKEPIITIWMKSFIG